MTEEKTEIRESHLRSVLKGLTWRIVATTVTFLLAKWVTGDIGKAVTIAGWEAVVKILVYYLHERAWQWMPRGTVRSWFGRKPSADA